MIDTHAHLYQQMYPDGLKPVVDDSLRKVEAVIAVGVDPETNTEVCRLSDRSKGVFAAIGIHPEEGCRDQGFILDQSLIPQAVAIGEIGLDYHYPETIQYKEYQQDLFEKQIRISIQYQLPVIIHSRDSFDDTYSILRKHPQVRGVWHSFTEGRAELEKILQLGLFVGLNGIITFPSAKALREVVKNVPMNRLLLETDAPLLAPVPFRGQINYPWMVQYVAEEIAEIKKVPIAEIDQITTENARHLFDLNHV